MVYQVDVSEAWGWAWQDPHHARSLVKAVSFMLTYEELCQYCDVVLVKRRDLSSSELRPSRAFITLSSSHPNPHRHQVFDLSPRPQTRTNSCITLRTRNHIRDHKFVGYKDESDYAKHI